MPLDSNSLYIISKPFCGQFHWALLVVDNRGITMRHKWAQDESMNNNTYTQEEVDVVMTYPGLALVYAKVQGYKPDPAAVTEVCRATSESTRPQGQQALASQTWVRAVLNGLEVRGLVRMDGGVAEVASRVVTWSKEQELLYLEAFMKGEAYVPAVERL